MILAAAVFDFEKVKDLAAKDETIRIKDRYLLSPLVGRLNVYWYQIYWWNFLYPSTIAKYGHLLLIRFQQSKTSTKTGESSYKSLGLYSRTLEQRVVAVPDEIYIHLLPHAVGPVVTPQLIK